jgi:hypothetical protein
MSSRESERQRKMTLFQKLHGVARGKERWITDAEQTAAPRMTNTQDLTLRRRADEPTSPGISEQITMFITPPSIELA